MKNTILFIGSYSEPSKNGIHITNLTGQPAYFTGLNGISGIANPSFLKLAHGHKILYAVSETDNGSIQAFNIAANGALTPAGNPQPSGSSPCHLSVDSKNRHLIASNYSGGSIAIFPLGSDGVPRPAIQRLHFSGKGPNPSRQEAPTPIQPSSP